MRCDLAICYKAGGINERSLAWPDTAPHDRCSGAKKHDLCVMKDVKTFLKKRLTLTPQKSHEPIRD